MKWLAWLTISLFFAASLAASTRALAAGTVQLDLVGDTRGAAMAFQEWAQALGKAGIRNVRIRAVEESDNVGVQVQGTPDRPVYIVTGIVRSRSELVMPGGRYSTADVGRLSQWLKELAEHGPAGEKAEKAAFGLSPAQFNQARKDLSAPVGFTTQGMSRAEAARKIASRLPQPMKLDSTIVAALGDTKCDDELNTLTSGTALAYLLRTARRGFAPHGNGDELSYEVTASRPDLELWPIGWTSEKSERETVPGLHEFFNVNVQNVSATTALDAIGKRLKLPVLLDRYALAKHSIDPGKVMLTLPRSKTTYSLALRKLLFQARLKFDVRYDDAGAPFLWVTTIKPTE